MGSRSRCTLEHLGPVASSHPRPAQVFPPGEGPYAPKQGEAKARQALWDVAPSPWRRYTASGPLLQEESQKSTLTSEPHTLGARAGPG